jgi:hypothetical protein
MKYTLIIIVLAALFYLWRFISAVVERGLPDSPIYYVSSVVGVIISYISFKLLSNIQKGSTKHRIFAIAPFFILLILSLVFNNSGINILRQIGSGIFFWYLLSMLGFSGYLSIKKWRLKSEHSESDETMEYMSKGFVLSIFALLLALIPIIILGILAFIIYLVAS